MMSSSSSSTSGSGGSGNDHAVMESPFDMDLGVEQRITGSETEQLRIRNVLRKMYTYFEEEVLTRSEYEHVRGRWCVFLYIMTLEMSVSFNLSCCQWNISLYMLSYILLRIDGK